MKDIIKKIENDKLLLEVSLKIYDKKAITATSYKFTDKAYIHIDPISEDIVGVYFKNKENSLVSLELIASEFCNELVGQQLRLNVENAYGNIRELIVKYAFLPIENIEEEIEIDKA